MALTSEKNWVVEAIFINNRNALNEQFYCRLTSALLMKTILLFTHLFTKFLVKIICFVLCCVICVSNWLKYIWIWTVLICLFVVVKLI